MFLDSRLHGNDRKNKPRLSGLGENVVAGQECPAYLVFEIYREVRRD
jgi:hypothetical protein